MELDNLKAKWQKDAEKHSQLNKKDMDQIRFILRGKASDLITSVRKNYEKIISAMLGSMVLILIVFAVISDGFTYPGSAYGFAKCMFFYLVLIIFYWEKLKNVNNLELSDHLKERLEQILKMLKRNQRIEVTFAGFFFVAFILVGRFFYGKGLNDIFKPEVVIGFAVAVLFTGFVIHRIIKRYKRQINEMEGYLGEYKRSDQ